jgi:cytochrome c peroxidase
MSIRAALLIVIALLLCADCGLTPAQRQDTNQPAHSACDSTFVGLGDLPDSEPDAQVVALGHRLFSDKRLSVDQTIACASCHRPDRALTDGKALPVGVYGRVGVRNSPSVYNVDLVPHLLWDGRGDSLEDQARLALTADHEMGMSEALVKQRLAGEQDAFVTILGEPPALSSVARAIAAYERTLRAANTPVDRFLYCNERDALTPLQQRGLKLFLGDANCIRCHVIAHESVHPFGGQIALFTDNRFHNIGISDPSDPGRAAITGNQDDWGAYKTPSLRNVALTAPYMHDGSKATLREVVEFYNRGGVLNPHLDPSIRPLGLTDEDLDALVEFLGALTSPEVEHAFVR